METVRRGLKLTSLIIAILAVTSVFFACVATYRANAVYGTGERDRTLYLLSDGWRLVTEAGEESISELRESTADTKTLVLRRYFTPEETAIGNLLFKNYRQVVTAYADGEQIYQRNTLDISKLVLLNIECFIPLPETDDGFELELRIENMTEDSCTVPDILLGSKYAVMRELFGREIISIICICVLVLLTVMTAIVLVPFWLLGLRDGRAYYLVLFILAVSIWGFTDTTLTLFIPMSAETACYYSYLTFMLLPLPIVFYVWRSCHERYWSLRLLCVLTGLNVLVQMLLSGFGLVYLQDMLFVTQGLIGFVAVVSLSCLWREMRLNRSFESVMLFSASALLTASCVMAVFFYWTNIIMSYRDCMLIGTSLFYACLMAILIVGFIRNLRQSEELQNIISCIIATVDAKDSYTADHSERVFEISRLIADALGLNAGLKKRIGMAAQMHDIGKIGVADSILGKPGKLTSEEYAVMKAHPSIGADIVSKAKDMDDIALMVLRHHERFDGSGYPDGIRGEEIPLGARIIAVADSIDAISSDRCYRKAIGSDGARAEIVRCSGSMYDETVVRAALSVWPEIELTLSRGR